MLVLNIGLHGFNPVVNKPLWAELRRALTEQRQGDGTRNSRIMWSETTAQHFYGAWGRASGEFMGAHTCYPNSDPETCDPIAAICVPRENPPSSTYNIAAQETLKKEGLVDLMPILPIERFTEARWELHDEGRNDFFRYDANKGTLHFRMDCTHQVYSPTYYQPQWDAIYRGLGLFGAHKRMPDPANPNLNRSNRF